MKPLFFTVIVFLFLPFSGMGQSSILEVKLLGCDSLPLLYTFNGFRFIPVQRGVEFGDNQYRFTLSAGPPRIMFVGSTVEEHVPVILGGSDVPLLEGHCLNLGGSSVYRSALNVKYREMQAGVASQREQLSALLISLSKANTATARQSVLDEIKKLDEQKMALLAEARNAHPLLGAYVGMFTYLSYPGLASGDREDEVENFGKNYFAQAALDDPVYNRIPQVYDAYLEYTQSLMRLSLSDALRQSYFESALARIPPGRPSRRLAYAGVLEGLKGQGFDLYAIFATDFLKEFPNLPKPLADEIRKEATRSRELSVGGQAPFFSQPDPAGEVVSLQGLRGKVVFVDFWASWCRPCRQENPRLREVYGAYHAQGFELVGISLDVERERWVRAIEADKITWLHGSDLLGWANQVVVDYRVGAIPHNVLIDRQGHILARNLSVDELENRLKELL